MEPATRRLIEQLHQAPCKYVLALTGGGSQAASLLLSVPGGSRTILEVVIPYHEQSLADFLGRAPEQYCSEAAAVAMADRAYDRASWLTPRDAVIGVGCTASLATDRPKKGDHRLHLAVRSAQTRTTLALTLAKGLRDREGEEHIAALLLLNALAEAQGVVERLPIPWQPGEAVQTATKAVAVALNDFLHGNRPFLCIDNTGQGCPDSSLPKVLLPGSFNPLHAGHWRMAAVARELTGVPVAFELSVANVDKPPLPGEEVRHRLRQFGQQADIWLTRAPRFVEKAALFPGVIFVVGADTAVRIIDPRYYEGGEAGMRDALERIANLGCRFLVAGRIDGAGRFVDCEQLAIPPEFAALFTPIPETRFRCDLSSTSLRSASVQQ